MHWTSALKNNPGIEIITVNDQKVVIIEQRHKLSTLWRINSKKDFAIIHQLTQINILQPGKYLWTADLLFILFGFSCFACDELKQNYLFVKSKPVNHDVQWHFPLWWVVSESGAIYSTLCDDEKRRKRKNPTDKIGLNWIIFRSSAAVKLETSGTVILPPMVGVLWLIRQLEEDFILFVWVCFLYEK